MTKNTCDKMRTLTAAILAAFSALSAPFKDGDRVVFFGDSITHGGRYGEYVNLFYATRYPERNIWFSNSGWSGARAEQGLWSIEDDIVAKKPTVVTVMFGMNDINRDVWPRTNDTPAFAEWRKSAIRTYDLRMDELVRRVRDEAGNPEIIYFTPSPYDQTCLVNGKPSDIICNDGLAILADHVRSWAERDKAMCVDLQKTMVAINAEMQKKDPSASLVRGSPTWFDRVHPGPLGHTVMLYEILKTQEAEGLVDEIERDAGGADALSFTCTEKALPFPMTAEMRGVLDLVPFERDFNREILRIKNLKEGRYAVKIDGVEVGTWTAAELAEGVNLALNEKTPQYRQAAEAANICQRLWSGERMLRDFATRRRWMKMHYKVDPDAPGAVEGIIEKLLADGKDEISYDVKTYRDYLKNWPRHAEFEAAVVKDRAALTEAVRPKAHRFEITTRAQSHEISLSGEWRLVCATNAGIACRMDVPGDVHSALLAAGLMKNPYWGRNELDTQWVGRSDWTLSRRFAVGPETLARREVVLRLEDCDTFATVKVNGVVAGKTSDRFQRYDFDVKPLLREGENEIELLFESAERIADERATQYENPYPMLNPPWAHNHALVRKPSCHAGWDWGLAQMSFSLGKAVILASDSPRVDYVYSEQTFNDDLSHCALTVFADMSDGSCVTNVVEIDNPPLWWPAGEGEQRFYTFTVDVNGEKVTRRIGLRKLEVLNERDAEGLSLVVRVNNRRLFMKGANWIPCDAFESRQTAARYRGLLESAVAANMNMVRLWGGGQYERDCFYDICDELGLLVWHDMMFSCAVYPGDAAFLGEVEKELSHQLRRLRDHASIALWCGDNECLGAIKWAKVTRENYDFYFGEWLKRQKVQEAVARRYDPTRIYWPSSPCCGPGDYGNAWKDDTKGDMHNWEVWGGNKPFADYYRYRPRFCSEFGYQSFPSPEVAATFCNGPGEDFEWHQKAVGGNKRIRETMARYFPRPAGFEEELLYSQFQQGMAIKTACEAWRAQRPRCMGTLFWQLNDNWPVSSWSSIEYGGKWKPLHYMARRFFAPVAVVAQPGIVDGSADLSHGRIVALNDTSETVRGELAVEYWTYGGNVLRRETMPVAIPPGSAVPVCAFARPAGGEPVFVALSLSTPGGEFRNDWHFGPYRDMPLVDAKIEAAPADGGRSLTLTTDAPAFFVWLDAKGAKGRFGDNCFTLLPGRPVTVALPDGVSPADVEVRRLRPESRPASVPERETPVLGYQLDISRCKVPKMETLYRIVDILAGLGYNQLQLYTEHTFAYKNHETVWREASPMTPEEVRALDDYCATRGIELVPNQNSFGHLEHWLRHPEYNGLANHPQGGARVARWGDRIMEQPSTLNPCDDASLKFIAGLYDELLPCFRSKNFNVGCDETVELEDADCGGRSAAAVREKGAARVYLDFLKKIYAEVKARGHVMMFWGDIVLNHPELLPELPDDIICLNWGYEKTSPFEDRAARLEAAGRKFIVCPGTSAWGSLSGRVENMLGNIDAAVAAGKRHGAMGYLLADWGDKGHPQPWIVSLPALVYLSHRAQGEEISRERLAKEIDRICGCACGEALLAYGEIYLKCGGRTGNSTELFCALTDGDRYERDSGVTDATLAAAFAHWRHAKDLLDLGGAPDWVKDDFALLDLLYRAVEVKMKEPRKPNFRAMFEPEYRRLWLRQNRVGGLKDSLVWLFGR